jgi:ribokinase
VAVNEGLAARLSPAMRLVWNAAPARAGLLPRADVLVVNRVEAAQMAGTDDPAAAADALRRAGPGAVVVTLGAAGLMLAEGAGPPVAMAAPAVTVVSTHGAGDAFCGARAAALAGGAPLAAACRLAQGAAALAVATPPDRRGTITREAAARLAGS